LVIIIGQKLVIMRTSTILRMPSLFSKVSLLNGFSTFETVLRNGSQKRQIEKNESDHRTLIKQVSLLYVDRDYVA
jgi:hypothetical protein